MQHFAISILFGVSILISFDVFSMGNSQPCKPASFWSSWFISDEECSVGSDAREDLMSLDIAYTGAGIYDSDYREQMLGLFRPNLNSNTYLFKPDEFQIVDALKESEAAVSDGRYSDELPVLPGYINRNLK